MKVLIASLIVLMTVPSGEWLNDFNSAKEVARSENHFILLNFSGSDWCAGCIRMKNEIFSTEVFKSFASQHLVLVCADFPRLKKNRLSEEQIRQNEKLAAEFNSHGKFPYTILLDPQGRVVTAWDGNVFSSAQELVDLIQDHIEEQSSR